MSEFVFEFDYDDYFGIPTVKIGIDQQCLYQDTVKKQIVVVTELLPGTHTLTIEHFGKHAWEHQKQIDSTIRVYETEVKQVDHQIDNIKEKTTIIKEYFHDVSQQVNHYDATQIDSFFKARYNY